MLKWLSKDIDVVFIDSATEKEFARSRTPLAQLPESFAVATTLEIQGQRWCVDSATPLTKRQFSKTRTLQLRVSRIESGVVSDVKELLYSLPTINDAIPPGDGVDVDGSEFVLHEDDWRQVEWVSYSNAKDFEAEIRAIQRIIQQERSGAGFKSVHIRKLITEPLGGSNLELGAALRFAGRDFAELRGLRLRDSRQRVRNGFAVQMGAGWLYGQLGAGRGQNAEVRVLGLHGVTDAAHASGHTSEINRVAFLVCWPAARAVRVE